MKNKWIVVFGFLFVFGIIAPVFGQEANFAYLDHLLVYKTGKYFYVNRWQHDQYTGPFSDKNGRMYTYGIGMFSDNSYESGLGYAEYLINGAYSRFDATLALEKKWIDGDYGTTRFIIYADGIEIYNKRFISSSEPEDISIVIPRNANLLRIEVEQIRGPRGTHGAIWGLAILKK